MRRRLSGRWWLLAGFFLAIGLETQAEEKLTIVSAEPAQPMVGQPLRLEVRLAEYEEGLAGRHLYVSTDFGLLSAPELVTGEDGIAVLEISSRIPGGGTAVLRSRSGVTARHTFRFSPASEGAPLLGERVVQAGRIEEISPRVRLDFLFPSEALQVETGAAVAVEIRAWAGRMPVAGLDVQLATSLGTVLEPDVTTDGAGVARFLVRSGDAGDASLTASAGSASTELAIEFVAADSLGSPWDGTFTMNSASEPVTLDIHPDRIGVLLADHASYADLRQMATGVGLSIGAAIGRRIYALESAEDLSVATRWRLVRNLRWRHGDKVRAAGLVAATGSGLAVVVIDELIYVRFAPELDRGVISDRLDGLPVTDVRATPYGINEFTLRVDPDSPQDPLALSIALRAVDDVLYAHPDIAQPLYARNGCSSQPADGYPWCDVRYTHQWQFENSLDTDSDLRKAWDFTMGSHDTLLAVIDLGFDVDHPDLLPNLWTDNLGKRGIVSVTGETSMMNNLGGSDYWHGTAVAGIAGAYGGIDNVHTNIGHAGACPRCLVLAIRVPIGTVTGDMKNAFHEAATVNAADVISMSLGFLLVPDNIVDDLKNIVIPGAEADGTVLVFAMDNDHHDHCGGGLEPDSASLEPVIGVGGVTHLDRRSETAGHAMGYGDCMDVLASTYGGYGTKMVSTDKVSPSVPPTSTYTHFFSGTSAATPLVGGVAALMRDAAVCAADAHPCLTPLEVQRALQDTADRVQPGTADYDPESGFSRPASGSTHAYGRMNAYEAVKLVAPTDKGGLNSKDLMLRDHVLDWGNTEQPSNTVFSYPRGAMNVFRSVDVKVDVDKDAVFDAGDPLNSFKADISSEEPVSGKTSRVYVRLRNRGKDDVNSATLAVHYAIYEDTLPDLPPDFWKEFPGPYTAGGDWHPLPPVPVTGLAYSGASAADCPARAVPACSGGAQDEAQVFPIDAPAVVWDPATHRLAWLVIAHSPEDPVQGKLAGTPPELQKDVLWNVLLDNNITLWTTGQLAPPSSGGTPQPCDGCGSPDPECPDWLQALLLLLALLLLALLAYIIYLLATGKQWPSWLLPVLVITLLLMAWTVWKYQDVPGCSWPW
jgi:hypothetical protein